MFRSSTENSKSWRQRLALTWAPDPPSVSGFLPDPPYERPSRSLPLRERRPSRGANCDLTSFPETFSWWISWRVLRKWHLQLHPILGGTANFAMSWETNLCNNYLEALGAALRSPGIAGIKRPAVGSDPSCWNCCPFLHLDLPIRGPQKILTCSLYCNLDSSQDCPLGTQTITFNKAKRMRRFWTSTSSTRLSLGFSTGFNSSQEYHLKRPASSKSCCKPSLIFSLKHPKTIPYPAKLAPKRHILQEVFQFICIYLPLGQAGPKHHDSQLGYFSPVGWTCFFGGIYGYLT